MDPHASFLRLDGLELRLATWNRGGPGPPVLALHGFAGCGPDFAPLAARLPGPVWAPDLVGHAGSTAPSEPVRYSLPAQAELVLSLVRTLELRRPVLLGYSFGGRLALQVLVRASEAFAGAILIGATAGIADPALRARRKAEDAELAASILREGVGPFRAAWAQRPIIATQQRIDPAHRARMERARAGQTAAGLAHTLQEAGTGAMSPLWEDLSAVRCPLLLLTGEEDAKFAGIARRLREQLPGAEWHAVPGAGHAPHLERPEATLTRARTFLSRACPQKPDSQGRGAFAGGVG